MTTTIEPNDIKDTSLIWVVTDSAIASVNDNVVTALEKATTNITAYVNENGDAKLDSEKMNDTIEITVTEKKDNPRPTGDRIPASDENLPIEDATVSGPNNITPVDISDWVNYNLSTSLPDYWSFIMGNKKVERCSDFYAGFSGGGFKFSLIKIF